MTIPLLSFPHRALTVSNATHNAGSHKARYVEETRI